MNKFWTLENSGEEVNYMFTKNHYVILLIGLVLIVFFSMLCYRQKFKSQRILISVFLIFLIIFEGLRIFWRYKYILYNGYDSSFVNIVDLNFSTISIWLTIIITLFGVISKKDNFKNVPGLSFVFSVASISCFISLIYPIGINTNFQFYHCYNLLYTLVRSVVILIGLSFAFSKWVNCTQFLDLWRGAISLLSFGIICYIIGFFLGNGTNLLYVNYFPLFYNLGINFVSPLHYLMMGVFFFVFQILLYTPFRIYQTRKNKKLGY